MVRVLRNSTVHIHLVIWLLGEKWLPIKWLLPLIWVHYLFLNHIFGSFKSRRYVLKHLILRFHLLTLSHVDGLLQTNFGFLGHYLFPFLCQVHIHEVFVFRNFWHLILISLLHLEKGIALFLIISCISLINLANWWLNFSLFRQIAIIIVYRHSDHWLKLTHSIHLSGSTRPGDIGTVLAGWSEPDLANRHSTAVGEHALLLGLGFLENSMCFKICLRHI